MKQMVTYFVEDAARSLLTAPGKSIVGFFLADSHSRGDSEPGEPAMERPNLNTALDDMKRMIRSSLSSASWLNGLRDGWLVDWLGRC